MIQYTEINCPKIHLLKHVLRLFDTIFHNVNMTVTLHD